ncbi:MAG TPA: TonB-dependent receptor [Chthoniobacterales bacterium]|nr:TonB-dependent receptor [Chthoniobacterales bacterium]
MRNRLWLLAVAFLSAAPISSRAQEALSFGLQTTEAESERIVVSATRVETVEEDSPATIDVIRSNDFEIKQTRRVADALRQVPGVSVVQSGPPGSLTSVFTRGLRSEHTQVLLDGIPINQGLQGAFNFGDLTTDNIDRIEIVRGPQSTLYGPRALAGVIQIFTKRGSGEPSGEFSLEGGSNTTIRGTLTSSGSAKQFDYSVGLSGLTTDNERPNNQYRLWNGIANLGWSPSEQVRLSALITYSLADLGLPNTIFDPRPRDNFLTERWLVAPHLDYKPVEWWQHRLIFSYDEERQVNDPNDDGFVGPTRALFTRATVDYQNDLKPASWLTLTSGFFYSEVDAGQERPFVLFGDKFIGDETEQTSLFVQASVTPFKELNLVAGGRYDHFNQFGDIWTYRFAGSYRIAKTDTHFHASVATGFSPPSAQDKIFGMNFGLEPEENLGWDLGVEQRFCQGRVMMGLTYFHNDLSNVIGFNGLFQTLNLGAARTQGIEAELKLRPIRDLEFTAAYTYLDAEKTSAADLNQPEGSRLPRRPRNEAYVSGTYLWFGKLRTTIEAKFVNAREELTFPPPDFLPTNIDIEDYAFVNLAAEYEINSCVSVFARINNLTDEQYSEVFGFPALGRTAFAGFKVRF